MQQQLEDLIDQFFEIDVISQRYSKDEIQFDFQSAPHVRPTPLRDQRALYFFFKDENWLRVGQTVYSPRFTSQHYGTRRAGSSFAKDVWENRIEFGYNEEENTIQDWLFENFGRVNIRFPKDWGEPFSKFFEAYMHLNLEPRFEGRRNI